MPKHIITLPDHLLSRSAARRSKHWLKQVTGVDTTKDDGYAFEGTFLQFEQVVEVPDGAVFMTYIEDTRATGRVDSRDVCVYVVRNGQLQLERQWMLGSPRGWALHIRDQVAAVVAAAAGTKPAKPELPAEVRGELVEYRDSLVKVREEIESVAGVSGDTRRRVATLVERVNQMLGEG